mmetsp:Transcript_16656/g.22952  ORF Transcript_16656/g.22952 Transcript_16656/m.22952 type:complete len:304 (+) Transcript_16656:3-914(+)
MIAISSHLAAVRNTPGTSLQPSVRVSVAKTPCMTTLRRHSLTSRCIPPQRRQPRLKRTIKSCRLGAAVASAGEVQITAEQVTQAEKSILKTISGMKSRGQDGSATQTAEVAAAIATLEGARGVKDPVRSQAIQGEWRLLYTSKSTFDFKNPLGKRVDGSTPGLEAVVPNIASMFGDAVAKGVEASSSPIQRTVTAIEAFEVSQNITLQGPDPRVDQLVKFGSAGTLRLSASAGTSPENSSRIDFTFDLAYFESSFLPFRVPYPVPFKLLGKEAQGWLDTSYLSDTLRISRGNKGTTFVFKRMP